jgi:hypothetical protein
VRPKTFRETPQLNKDTLLFSSFRQLAECSMRWRTFRSLELLHDRPQDLQRCDGCRFLLTVASCGGQARNLCHAPAEQLRAVSEDASHVCQVQQRVDTANNATGTSATAPEASHAAATTAAAVAATRRC